MFEEFFRGMRVTPHFRTTLPDSRPHNGSADTNESGIDLARVSPTPNITTCEKTAPEIQVTYNEPRGGDASALQEEFSGAFL